MKKKTGPDMGKWKDYRRNLLSEDVEKYKHPGDYVSSRDIYEKIQEFGGFNRDFPVEVVDIEKVWEPDEGAGTYSITDIKLKNGKLVIEII